MEETLETEIDTNDEAGIVYDKKLKGWLILIGVALAFFAMLTVLAVIVKSLLVFIGTLLVAGFVIVLGVLGIRKAAKIYKKAVGQA